MLVFVDWTPKQEARIRKLYRSESHNAPSKRPVKLQSILSSLNACILTGRKCVVGILFSISPIIADIK